MKIEATTKQPVKKKALAQINRLINSAIFYAGAIQKTAGRYSEYNQSENLSEISTSKNTIVRVNIV